jgi:hypothetical protein
MGLWAVVTLGLALVPKVKQHLVWASGSVQWVQVQLQVQVQRVRLRVGSPQDPP